MRFLFTFAGGSGHLNPLIPLARAAEAAGHTVAFAGQPALVPMVEAAGFTAFSTGGNSFGTPKPGPLLAYDATREDRGLSEGFADRIARDRAAHLLDLCGQWRPDLVICDEIDFGAMVVAERLGLPHASVLVIAAGSFNRTELVAEPLGELRAEHGLPPDPDLRMLSRYLVLSPVPPSFRDPAFPLPDTATTFRPVQPDVAEPAPAWLAALPAAPTVYFTLGTVFNIESGDLFSRVLRGVRDLPTNVVVTVGNHIDPADLGPQPANVHIEQYVPQSVVLRRCGAVISHGGSGSVIGALSHGLPSVLFPMGADQPHNAARCQTLGAARVMDPLTATPAEIRAALSEVLTDPAYRHAAERIRAEAAAQPGPDHAATLLEHLASNPGRVAKSR
ncbi:glycosyltransferase [Saccharopolyspora sp. 5N708]|uniref:glycosyltransferase n=1 Tax=Saccharopolyspora sp. 5N708 TaxID=3457424 RepID=UPI003FD29B7A